ncbi:MAG: DinB family protein, partial [Proteobacteria bacterium]
EKTAKAIDDALKTATAVIMNASEEKLSRRSGEGIWSAKEILGHLIDSALHNLVRFTEAQHLDEPYRHRKYDQEQLVLLNDYQHQETEDLLVLWLSLNRQISKIVASADETIIARKVVFGDGTSTDLKFLMKDYVDHLDHHLHKMKSLLK